MISNLRNHIREWISEHAEMCEDVTISKDEVVKLKDILNDKINHMGNRKYDSGLRDKIIHLHLEEGRSLRSLTEEYDLGNGTAKYWVDRYRKDCIASEEGMKQLVDHNAQKELLKRIEELEKENRFLKKAAAFFAKEID